ncbi:hypothetical protein [Planctomycetes bacterium K23_9]|uniref:Uncharacterized protein n=1 Tax=Stieleria marina TaxID=1930275 RepID=A0A517NQS7_9BACT|nr:hypothetical protein K239x_14160 [Planctomycetes bacterium K23_9]
MNRHSLFFRQPKFATAPRRSGIILLVVLTSLTFFSLLVVTYLVFSSQSRQSAFAMNIRTTRSPDVNELIEQAMLTLVRGPSDPNSPFRGESLLDDYWGGDGVNMRAHHVNSFAVGPFNLGKGFVRFPAVRQTATPTRAFALYIADDLMTGRYITFRQGPLANRTFRVVKSIYDPGAPLAVPPLPAYDNLYIELESKDWDPSGNVLIQSLFYRNPSDLTSGGYAFRLNGVPQNSPGVGLSGGNLDATVATASMQQGRGFADLPVSLQPNHLPQLGATFDKLTTSPGFDEAYDAPDAQNWFLAFRHPDGTVIPSFHRPSVINYILNEMDWSSATDVDFADVVASLARSTMRPLPIAAGQFDAGTPSPAVNPRFTGGNANFALRTPLLMRQAGGAARLDQVAKALINDFDVDNDGDGQPDSIWIDIGLPQITSPEGKLIQPLVAVMIEDLSGRLNLNAIGNSQLNSITAGVRNNPNAMWAGTRNVFQSVANRRNAFRGIGYGPADIMLPTLSTGSGLITNGNVLQDIARLLGDRYGADAMPGADSNAFNTVAVDALDTIRHGYRPVQHTGRSGFGRSQDPFGRGGIGIGRGGDLVASDSGVIVSTTPASYVNESYNDPYEMDPAAKLGQDAPFTFAELETILRSNDFSSELLPQELRDRLLRLLSLAPEYSRVVTTASVSHDGPPTLGESTALIGFLERAQDLATAQLTPPATAPFLTPAQIPEVVPAEFRLGRKIDVNRSFGNRVDDNGNTIIDEPGEVFSETNSVGTVANQAVPVGFQTSLPLSQPTYQADSTTASSGRDLLARNLYVLMRLLIDDGFDFPSVTGTAFSAADADAYKARRLAQWAVNVVDYRDPDAIMTRFVFDPNPFDGWNPGAATVENTVWGVEAPALLFSESLALHDTRLNDGTDDNGGGDDKMSGDADSDQVRIPQGSLFLELVCAHPTISSLAAVPPNPPITDESAQPSFPQELYDASGALDLLKANPNDLPVWRIAISEPHAIGTGKENLDPMTLRDAEPDFAALAPESLQDREIDASLGAGNGLDLERFIFFRHFDNQQDIRDLITNSGITDMGSNEVFFTPNSDLRLGNAMNVTKTLLPGQYMAIAPRKKTHLGSKEVPLGTFPGAPSQQRFEVDATQGVVQFEQGIAASNMGLGARTTPDFGAAENYTPALPLIIGTFRPDTWPIATFEDGYVGLNVSEPLPRDELGNATYYPQPLTTYNDSTLDNDGDGNPDYELLDAYFNYSDPSTSSRDTPLDLTYGIIPTVGGGAEPDLGTIPQFRTAYLQRLADPTLPYNVVTNPYRTVDLISIDLTVFTGEDRDENINTGGASYATSSRQRNGFIRTFDSGGTSSTTAAGALFSYETAPTVSAGTTLTSDDYFSFSGTSPFIQNSLSFLNTATTGALNRGDINNVVDRRNGRSNPGFVGFQPSIGSQSPAGVTTNDRNLPIQPFSLHPWLNRPFASHLELMMVPACSQTRLLEEYTHNLGGDPDVYPDTAGSGADDPVVFNAPFRHLLNFFHSSDEGSSVAEFGRLFDFVHTLPRFRGEVDMITPAQLAGGTTAQQAELARMRTLLAPPFNFSYDNLRQGRVNLNTLAEFQVWAGLMQGHLNDPEFTSPALAGGVLSFESFLLNRRGYAVGTTPSAFVNAPRPTTGYNYNPNKFDPRFPTQFAGVYKPGTDAIYAPLLRSAADTDLLRRREVNGTVLRGSGTVDTSDPAAGPPTTAQMFVRSATQAPLPTSATELHMNRDRNPFIRYQTAMRMPNLASNNSQMFLMRMKMGFFEVDAGNIDSVGAEYKADVGQSDRYGAMFIIDRSRPVGFSPGQDLNVRETIVFESYDQ